MILNREKVTDLPYLTANPWNLMINEWGGGDPRKKKVQEWPKDITSCEVININVMTECCYVLYIAKYVPQGTYFVNNEIMCFKAYFIKKNWCVISVLPFWYNTVRVAEC